MKKGQKLLKISEAAELLNVHPNTLRQWDQKGILKAIRFGQRRDRRYSYKEISELIKRRK